MPKRPLTLADVRRIALALADTSERPCYGTPGFYVKKSLFARMKEDGDTVVLKCDPDQKDALIESAPDVFFTTPHYDGYPYVLLRLGAASRALLEQMLEDAWRFATPVAKKRKRAR
jgi:hypothetical protein